MLLAVSGIQRVAAQPITEGGSPLYVIAVRESVQGLRGDRKAPAQAAPTPAAAQRPAAAATPGAAGTNAVAGFQPTPEFLSRYYFCTNCQAYHLRSPSPASTNQQNLSNALTPGTSFLTNQTLFPTNRPPATPRP